ncbi:MAG TPA: hypothetical protein VFQ36_06020 [Ktedonobacteraceae bacterium]|nr:hypothetical protein [Ktedonobacteraceae bacterium]
MQKRVQRHPTFRLMTACLVRGVTSCRDPGDRLPTQGRDILPLAPHAARFSPGAQEAVKEALVHEREQDEEHHRAAGNQ